MAIKNDKENVDIYIIWKQNLDLTDVISRPIHCVSKNRTYIQK